MGGRCCICGDKIDHEKEEIYEALGISGDRKNELDNIIRDAITRAKVSEMLEYIWKEKCSETTLEERIYATLRLGMDLYALILESIIQSAEEEKGVSKTGKKGAEAS